MGKRHRTRLRKVGLYKQPNESKAAFRVRLMAWLNSLDIAVPSPNFGDDR